MCSCLGILRNKRTALFLTIRRQIIEYRGQPERRELQYSRRERMKAETSVAVASVVRRLRMEPIRRSSKLAVRTRSRTWVFRDRWQST